MIADPALIVVDMQRDFCDPDGALEVEAADVHSAVAATGDLLERYRESGRTPILVRTIHDPDVDSDAWHDMYERNDRTKPCKRGTEGVAFAPELGPAEDDVVVTKHRYDAFYGTALDTYLSANDVSRVVVCGVATNVCVDTTVRAAFVRDYDVTVPEDCVGTHDAEQRDPTLANVEAYFGDVRQSTDISFDPV